MLTASRLLFRFADELDPDALSAFEKLAEALPAQVARQLQATVGLLRHKPHNQAQSTILRQITEGWATLRSVEIDYRSSESPDYRATTLHPYLIEPAGAGALYVIGFSERHEAVRTFKLDRIRDAQILSTSFVMNDEEVEQLIKQLSS